MDANGSHGCGSPANIRTGIATAAENGTYDRTVMARSLSWKNVTPR